MEWETKYGRFTTVTISKYEHSKRKINKLTHILCVRCSFWRIAPRSPPIEFAPTLCRVRPHTFRVRPHQVEFAP